jgi:rfaE bifunctional protein kinase chain/domain
MADIPSIIRNRFPAKNVVVLGDIVADQFLSGTISRVSREAPVFILRHDETVTLPGGAANAAANVASLGGSAVMVGRVGSDEAGSKVVDALEAAGVDTSYISHVPGIRTTTKVRVLAGQNYAARQQVIRIDYEDAGEADGTQADLRKAFASAAAKADALIISDYNCGAIFTEIIDDALGISRERNVPLVVDSRYSLSSLAGATTATPNREEVEQVLGINFTPEQCSALREELKLEALLVTNGNLGMSLFEAGQAEVRIPAVGSIQPIDVTGAGDTVIAAYALALASGLSFKDAAEIANHAGGIVVMKKGTACALPDELIGSIARHSGSISSDAK